MKGPRLVVNPNRPRAAAHCQRCDVLINRDRLVEQKRYAGTALVGTGLYVCSQCYDTPNPQLKPRRIDPDPVPIRNPAPPRW